MQHIIVQPSGKSLQITQNPLTSLLYWLVGHQLETMRIENPEATFAESLGIFFDICSGITRIIKCAAATNALYGQLNEIPRISAYIQTNLNVHSAYLKTLKAAILIKSQIDLFTHFASYFGYWIGIFSAIELLTDLRLGLSRYAHDDKQATKFIPTEVETRKKTRNALSPPPAAALVAEFFAKSYTKESSTLTTLEFKIARLLSMGGAIYGRDKSARGRTGMREWLILILATSKDSTRVTCVQMSRRAK
jgi:hypothetical protein